MDLIRNLGQDDAARPKNPMRLAQERAKQVRDIALMLYGLNTSPKPSDVPRVLARLRHMWRVENDYVKATCPIDRKMTEVAYPGQGGQIPAVNSLYWIPRQPTPEATRPVGRIENDWVGRRVEQDQFFETALIWAVNERECSTTQESSAP